MNDQPTLPLRPEDNPNVVVLLSAGQQLGRNRKQARKQAHKCAQALAEKYACTPSGCGFVQKPARNGGGLDDYLVVLELPADPEAAAAARIAIMESVPVAFFDGLTALLPAVMP